MTTTKEAKSKGTYRTCSRCKGTGQARFNHMNGDTYCYLCMGEGLVYKPTQAERERAEADSKWASDAYYRLVGGSGSYQNQIRRPVRAATTTTPYVRTDEREAMTAAQLAAYEAGQARDRQAAHQLERRLCWWVGEGLEQMQVAQGEERRAHEAAQLQAARAARAAA